MFGPCRRQVNLIDSKRSMNVNIFLRQFRISHADIVDCIRRGLSEKIGPERLRGLLKIVPEPEEVELLTAFDGDRAQLGNAERFYVELLSLSKSVAFTCFDTVRAECRQK